eukprot:scaffold482_cov266-Amphora_coffeaeformis.AAC.11
MRRVLVARHGRKASTGVSSPRHVVAVKRANTNLMGRSTRFKIRQHIIVVISREKEERGGTEKNKSHSRKMRFSEQGRLTV